MEELVVFIGIWVIFVALSVLTVFGLSYWIFWIVREFIREPWGRVSTFALLCCWFAVVGCVFAIVGILSYNGFFNALFSFKV